MKGFLYLMPTPYRPGSVTPPDDGSNGVAEAEGLFLLVTQGKGHAQAHAGDGHAGGDSAQRDNGVVTVGGEELDHLGDEDMVHAGHDQELPQSADDRRADEAEVGAEPDDALADVGAQEAADGAADAQGNGQHDGGSEGGDQHDLESVRNVGLEEALHVAHDPDGEQDGQDGAAVILHGAGNARKR